MTVINNPARDQYIATGGQTIFNYTFEISNQANIQVFKRAASAAPDDAADILLLTVDYTVTGVGVNTGGTIILNSGATLGDIVTLQGNAPPVRSTSFTPGGVIQAQNLNNELDDEVLIYQTILATQDFLVPKYPKSAIVRDGIDNLLPNLPANMTWQMNAAGNEIIASTLLSGEELASHSTGQGASLIGLHPTGTVQDLANAPFILRTANAAAPNAQALGALTDGILRNASTSGVLSISAPLTSIDNVVTAADEMLYTTGADAYAATPLTAYARTLLDDANAAAARTTLGLAIGVNVQAWNANLQSISALGTAADKMIYTTGVNTWAESDLSAYSRTLLDNADLAAWQTQLGIPGGGASFFAIANNLSEGVPATMRTNLGLVIGTDVQAWDATLESLSALGTMAGKYAYTTGVDTWAEGTITALGRSLLDDATQADMNTTIGSLPLAGGTMTGDLFLNGPAVMGNQAVTLSQLNAVILNEQLACVVATPSDMPTWTYLNGTLGVGATLTAPINGATTFDGITPTNGQRVLVLFQTTNPAWQGAYTIVQGTGGTPTVLTRATDWDQAAEMNAGDIFSVVTGTTYGASQWMFAQTGAITVGTTALTFTQLAGQGSLLKANNLSDLPSPATARVNLGLVIGTNVQAQDATLQSLSALGTAADRIAYTTGVDTWAETAITSFGRSAINLTGSANGVWVTNNSSAPAILAGPAATGRVLQSNAAAAPSWSTATYPATATGTGTQLRADGTNWVPSTSTYADTYAVSTLLYASSANVITGLDTANNAILKTNATGVPSLTTLASLKPTFTSLLSSSGNYTTPAGVISLEVEMVGGGGGGGGSGSGGSVTGGNGGNTTFGANLAANGGTGGPGGLPPTGGTATLGGELGQTTTGGYGCGGGNSSGTTVNFPGGNGGSSALGGAGGGGIPGNAGLANTGGGGGGGYCTAAAVNQVSGAGGGAGGHLRAILYPTAGQVYAYAVAAGGTAGAAGTSGNAGGAGGTGGIWVKENYI